MFVRLILTLMFLSFSLAASAATLFDFEDGTVQGWFADDLGGRDTHGLISCTTTTAWSGIHSLEAIVISNMASWDFAPCIDIPYVPGTIVSASFWAAYHGTGSGARIWLEWRAADHSFLASAGGQGSYVNTTNWEQSAHVSPGTNLAGVAYCRIQARIYGFPGDILHVDAVEYSASAGAPPSATTNIVVAWDFQDTNQLADAGLPTNLAAVIIRETNFAGTYTYSSGAGSTYALSSSGWQDGIGTKCWEIQFDASGVALLSLSSKQRSSGTGPRDFIVQCRIDPEAEWTNVPGGIVTTANDAGSTWQGTLVELPLPTMCDNQTSVYVRWVESSTNAVTSGAIAAGGTSRIDDIVVTGAMVPEPVAGMAILLWSAAARRRFVSGAARCAVCRLRSQRRSCPPE